MRQLISDGDGQVSSMRVMSLAIVIPVMIVWTVLCIRQNQFIIPDGKIIMLVSTALGGKAIQSFSENFAVARPANAGETPALAGSPQTTTQKPNT